ncbi:MAG: PDGLE domain-containing protein [Ilumatobacteraceae bacterium]
MIDEPLPPTGPARQKVPTPVFLAVGLLVVLGLAFFASQYASSSPDGLEKVAADKGIDADVEDHALGDGPLADYSVAGIDDEGTSTGVAGVIGVGTTLAIAFGGFFALSRVSKRNRQRKDPIPG